MAVVVARMVASLQAETTQFHARMTAAERQLNKWTSATVTGRRGTMMLQQGLQQLAVQATGVTGPVGKVASGLLTIGAGGGAALVAAAGIGLVVGAVRLFTTEARENIKAQEEMIASLNKLGAAGQVTAARLQINMLKQLRDNPSLWQRLKEIPGAFLGDITGGLAGTTAAERTERINRKIAELEGTIGASGVDAARKRAEVEERRRTDLAFREHLRTLKAGVPGPLPMTMRFPEPAPFLPGDVRLRGITDPRLIPEQQQIISSQGGPGSEPERFKMTPEFAIMSSMALLQGAQGGAAGLFGAAAGPVAMINPLAGAITAGIGGIFSLFDNSEERRHKALLDKLDKLGQEVGLERVTVVFTGPDGHQVRKSLAELEEGDAVERVPGPVGAGG